MNSYGALEEFHKGFITLCITGFRAKQGLRKDSNRLRALYFEDRVLIGFLQGLCMSQKPLIGDFPAVAFLPRPPDLLRRFTPLKTVGCAAFEVFRV